MTWDGIPEHRNLHGDGEPVPDLSPESSAARFLDAAARRAEAEAMRQRYLSDIARHREETRGTGAAGMTPGYAPEAAARFGRPQPEPDPMPPDPFAGGAPGAIAQAEMVESLIEGGWPEHRACYYVACLVSVGLAMQRAGMMDRLPPWPHQPPEGL